MFGMTTFPKGPFVHYCFTSTIECRLHNLFCKMLVTFESNYSVMLLLFECFNHINI